MQQRKGQPVTLHSTGRHLKMMLSKWPPQQRFLERMSIPLVHLLDWHKNYSSPLLQTSVAILVDPKRSTELGWV